MPESDQSMGYSMDDFAEESMASVASTRSPKHSIKMPTLPTISAAEDSTDSAPSDPQSLAAPAKVDPGVLERSNRSVSSFERSNQSVGYSMDDFDEDSMGVGEGGGGATKPSLADQSSSAVSAASEYSQDFDYSARFEAEESISNMSHQASLRRCRVSLLPFFRISTPVPYPCP